MLLWFNHSLVWLETHFHQLCRKQVAGDYMHMRAVGEFRPLSSLSSVGNSAVASDSQDLTDSSSATSSCPGYAAKIDNNADSPLDDFAPRLGSIGFRYSGSSSEATAPRSTGPFGDSTETTPGLYSTYHDSLYSTCYGSPYTKGSDSAYYSTPSDSVNSYNGADSSVDFCTGADASYATGAGAVGYRDSFGSCRRSACPSPVPYALHDPQPDSIYSFFVWMENIEHRIGSRGDSIPSPADLSREPFQITKALTWSRSEIVMCETVTWWIVAVGRTKRKIRCTKLLFPSKFCNYFL